MKIILKQYCLLLLISFCNCNTQDALQGAYNIVYKAQTRGNSITITIEKNQLLYESNTDNKMITLNEDEIQAIKESVNQINLETINNLKAPTNNRFTDGALFASFTIIKNNEKYKSSEFDHQSPPKELKSLYELLLEIKQ